LFDWEFYKMALLLAFSFKATIPLCPCAVY
jgi:hypothetical protein